MFSLFKKKTPLPKWASFFNEKEYHQFIAAIDRYFKSIAIHYELDNDAIIVQDEMFGSGVLGLTNVAQVCKQEDERNFDEVVADYFNSLRRAIKFSVELYRVVDHFSEIEKYIGVRLYPDSFIAQLGADKVIFKTIAPGVNAVLVFDLPETIQTITPDKLKIWGRSVEELFELGITNINNNYPLTATQEPFTNFKIWFVTDGHFFVPNIVFNLANKPELLGSYGSLLGLPHRHSAIIYPIETLEIVQVINKLVPAIYNMNIEGPGSLTNNLFWYHNGTFTNLPYQISDQIVQFIPPENFLNEVLNKLE